MTEWYKWFSDKFNKLLTEQKVFENVVDTNFGEGEVIIKNLQSGVPFDVRKTLLTGGMGEDILRGSLKSIFKDTDSMDVKVKKIAQWVNARLTYISDQKNYAKPEYWADAYTVYDRKKDDCFAYDTLLLKSDGNLVSIEDLQVGDEVIGEKGKPTKIIYKSYKGVKPIMTFGLNNSSCVGVSAEHTFSVASNKQSTNSQKWIDKKATQVKIGDQLECTNDITFPDKIHIGYDLGYLFGLYLADGWVKSNSIYIAGKDGCKKQAQKEWVKKYCEKNNIDFYMHSRYCYFRSNEILSLIKQYFGESGAGKKKIKVHNFDLDGVKGLLEGLKADACERDKDLTYSSINPSIALAIRIWYRMIGVQVSIKKVDKHGGFGSHPIYRIGVRLEKSRRVLVDSITTFEEKPTYNITTTCGKVYLPESDIVIRQCDGYAVLIMTLMRLAGVPAWRRRIVVGEVDSGEYHAYIVYFSEDHNDWFALEGSYYATEALANFNNVPYIKNIRYKTPEWCFNEDTAWTIGGKEIFISKLK